MQQAQTWNTTDYGAHAPFVARLGTPVLDLLTVRPPARVLDLGCGEGALTAELAARGYEVVGVDASEAMVAATRARGLAAQLADGHDLPFLEPSFDAVFSNATLHWLTRPDAVLAGIHRALVPGGEVVGELGGAGNVQRVVRALVAGLDARGLHGASAVPWYFPSPGEYATQLERAGLRVELVALFDRPTKLPTDLIGWIDTFGQSFTHRLPSDQRARYLREVRDVLADELVDEDGAWVLDYVRLRFRATKPR